MSSSESNLTGLVPYSVNEPFSESTVNVTWAVFLTTGVSTFSNWASRLAYPSVAPSAKAHNPVTPNVFASAPHEISLAPWPFHPTNLYPSLAVTAGIKYCSSLFSLRCSKLTELVPYPVNEPYAGFTVK